jgi:hypothetical protein
VICQSVNVRCANANDIVDVLMCRCADAKLFRSGNSSKFYGFVK